MRFLYVCLTCCYVVPLSFAIFAMRLLGRTPNLQRLGRALPKIAGDLKPIWLVASSVGEVTIALRLIERLKQSITAPVILSVTTSSGRARALQAQTTADAVIFQPFDLTRIVRRSFKHFRPKLIILIETELWPVMMEQAFESGVKVAQVSGRISEKSHRRYRALKPFFAPIISRCSLLLMQSEDDASRIRDIAGVSAPVEVIGSIKEDYSPPATEAIDELKRSLSGWNGKFIFTCGSTRPSEESILCDALLRLQEQRSDLKMIIAPRHLERVDEVEEILRSRRIPYQRWTEGSLRADTCVLLLDTIGKLNAAYHLSDIAFVGGTLAPLGGHNLLEPALAGCPVLHGPHYFQQLRGHALLREFEMDIPVADADEVAKAVNAVLCQNGSRQLFQARAERLRRASSHVLDHYFERLRTLISDD